MLPIDIPDEVPDVGNLLRTLREAHGYTINQLAKRVGVNPQEISEVELSKRDVPNDIVLTRWLKYLGLSKRQMKKVLNIARAFQVKHVVRLHRNDINNPDIIRLIFAYQEQKLSSYDRAMLHLLCRTKEDAKPHNFDNIPEDRIDLK